MMNRMKELDDFIRENKDSKDKQVLDKVRKSRALLFMLEKEVFREYDSIKFELNRTVKLRDAETQKLKELENKITLLDGKLNQVYSNIPLRAKAVRCVRKQEEIEGDEEILSQLGLKDCLSCCEYEEIMELKRKEELCLQWAFNILRRDYDIKI